MNKATVKTLLLGIAGGMIGTLLSCVIVIAVLVVLEESSSNSCPSPRERPNTADTV